MMTSTIRHPKFRRLRSRLARPEYQIVGVLQSLWMFAGEHCPEGDIGRYSDADIAAAIDWEGEPADLVAALVDTGWVDRDARHRLVIHHWLRHCERWVREKIRKSRRRHEMASDGDADGSGQDDDDETLRADRERPCATLRDSARVCASLRPFAPACAKTRTPNPNPSPRLDSIGRAASALAISDRERRAAHRVSAAIARRLGIPPAEIEQVHLRVRQAICYAMRRGRPIEEELEAISRAAIIAADRRGPASWHAHCSARYGSLRDEATLMPPETAQRPETGVGGSAPQADDQEAAVGHA